MPPALLIKIIAVGKLKDRHFQAKCEEFLRWLSPHAKVELVEVKDSDKLKESNAILKLLESEKGYLCVLGEEGKMLSSREFAGVLGKLDRKLVLVIGGPFGLSDAVKEKADLLLSLSRMTMTHEMARVWLLEQLFRGIAINSGKPYHHD